AFDEGAASKNRANQGRRAEVVSVSQLQVMTGHRLVHVQIANFIIVIFAKERVLSLLRPVLWCWRDSKEGPAIPLKRTGRLAIGNGYTAFEFGHCNHVERRVRNGDKIMRLNEISGFSD